MITFVIPAKNEEHQLPHTLKAIHASAKKLSLKYEIVVCNNGSTDKTQLVAKKFGAKVVDLAEPNIAKAKNTAAAQAKGEGIIFVDADTQVTQELLTQALSTLAKPKIQAVSCLTSFKKYPTLSSRGVWLYNIMSWLFRLGAGHFMVVKKAAFTKVNGFSDTVYAYEDIDLFKKLKKEYGYTSVKVLATSVKTSARKFEAGHDVKGFLLGLIGASLGFNIARNKDNLSFWYGKPQLKSRRYYINRICALIVFILLTLDLFGLIGTLGQTALAQNIAILLIFGLSSVIILKSPLELLLLPLLFVIEYIGLKVHMPFGTYTYSSTMWSVLGVPLFIPLAWFVVVKSTFLGLRSLFGSALFVVAVDVILEAFATNNELWTWAEHTGKLVAPYQNYLAWYFIALGVIFVFKKVKLDTGVDRYHAVLNFTVIGFYIALLSGTTSVTAFGLVLFSCYALASLIIAASKV